MNLNKKIKKFTGDGIPAYNEKFNELIDVANWLLGVRTINGKTIAESDQGPIIDLSQVSTTQSSGDATAIDPDGNRAGWRKIILIDSVKGQFFDVWAWTGSAVSNIRNIPWWYDPTGLPANWIICPDNTFWGTGGCPATAGAERAKFTQTPSPANGTSPCILTFTPQNPITPPTGGSTIYFIANDAQHGIPSPIAPVIYIANNNPAGSGLMPLNFNFHVTYEGVTLFDINGSDFGGSTPGGYLTYQLPTAGWVFDPSGVPGYAKGNNQWIWTYKGTPTANQNPVIIETLTFSGSLATLYQLMPIYLSG